MFPFDVLDLDVQNEDGLSLHAARHLALAHPAVRSLLTLARDVAANLAQLLDDCVSIDLMHPLGKRLQAALSLPEVHSLLTRERYVLQLLRKFNRLQSSRIILPSWFPTLQRAQAALAHPAVRSLLTRVRYVLQPSIAFADVVGSGHGDDYWVALARGMRDSGWAAARELLLQRVFLEFFK